MTDHSLKVCLSTGWKFIALTRERRFSFSWRGDKALPEQVGQVLQVEQDGWVSCANFSFTENFTGAATATAEKTRRTASRAAKTAGKRVADGIGITAHIVPGTT